MPDLRDRLREMDDQRRRDVQTKMNQIYLDRSIRAAERGAERRREEKAFRESAAAGATRPVLTDRDVQIMDQAERIAIYGGCLVAIVSICTMIIHFYPTIVPLGYGLIIGLGLLAGWITFKFLASDGMQDILELVVRFPKTAIVVMTVGGLVVLIIWRHAS
jgi:hypothetical protein